MAAVVVALAAGSVDRASTAAAEVAPAAPPAAEVYVAPGGNDAWSGRLSEPNAGKTDGPVATLGRAVELARAARGTRQDGYTVLVRAGTYYLPDTLALGPQDSGTAERPTRLAAWPGETPRLVAGRRLSAWTPWKGAVVQCDLKAAGLGGVGFRELYCEGQRQVLARYPNLDSTEPNTKGWLYVEAPLTKGNAQSFLAYAGDLKPWADLSQAEVFEFHDVNYYNTVVAVKSVDPAEREVHLGAATYGAFAGNGAERYFFQNLLEELDAPGEWYLDRKTSVLYVWPPAPIATASVEVPTLDYAVHLQAGAAYVTIEGFTIEVARRTAVQVDEAQHCRVARCTIRNVGVGTQIGGWGPWENCCGIALFGGRDNGAVGNDIFGVGGHGIKLTGGDDKTLTPASNFAENNYIHHTGLDWKQGCGVRLEGVGNRFSGNTLHDIPRMGVIFGGHDHIMERNHMYRLSLETCDTGAIYTGGRDAVTPWGCVIRHNYIHDVIGFGREHGKWGSPTFSWGIYLDDLASGASVYGNIVVGCLRGGVHIHSGRYNRIENNILVGGTLQQIEFSGWTEAHPYWASSVEARQKNWEQRQALPEWQRRYPELFLKPPREWPPLVMSGNRIERNILVATDSSAAIYRCNSLPYDQTSFDHNVLWLGGRPVRTGMGSPKVKAIGEKELCPNPGFEDGTTGALPPGWEWYARPSAAAQARLSTAATHGGSRAMEVVCAPADPGSQFEFAMVKTVNLPVEPGRSYCLAGWFKASRPDLRVNLVAQSYREKQYHWARETNALVGTEWKRLEFGFTTPALDQPEASAGMRDLYLRIDCREQAGIVWIDDLSLREAETVDEWTAWQDLGLDRHSVVADPLFVDATRGDYRLKPDSPALGLGFEPIPVEKIGCYADPLRASWPLGSGR